MNIVKKELRELAPPGVVGLLLIVLFTSIAAHFVSSAQTGIRTTMHAEMISLWLNLSFLAAGLLCLGIGTAVTSQDRDRGIWPFIAALPMSHRRIWLEKTLAGALICLPIVPIVMWFLPESPTNVLWEQYGLLAVAFAGGNLMGLSIPGFINAAASGATIGFSAGAVGIIFYENQWAGADLIHAGFFCTFIILLSLAAYVSGRQT